LVQKIIFLSAFLLLSTVCSAQTGQTTNQPDILDSLVSIFIILFILSVIVEKITQLIRKYAPFIKPQSRIKRSKAGQVTASVWRNIHKKETGNFKELDKRIEREVNSLSFTIGVVIALIFRVDLIKMFRAPDPRTVLFWSDGTTYDSYEKFAFVFSIAMTGFFLTFGSKFFHDVLDNLLQIKNLKRKLLDDNTYNVETIKQLDEYIAKTYTEIIQAAIDQNQSLLEHPDRVSPPLHGKTMKKSRLVDCIDIHLSGADRGSIPHAVTVKLSGLQTITIPVNVILDVETPTALNRQGDTIACSDSIAFKGTICCKVRRTDQKVYLLTCSHVLTNGSGRNLFGEIHKPISGIIAEGFDCNFTWAVCNDDVDLAALQPEADDFNYVISPKKERKLTPADMLSTKVKVVKQNGRVREDGMVVNFCSPRPIPIQYTDGKFNIRNLIILSKVTKVEENMVYATLTIPGDSGACVYDENDHPIGMIIAGNSKFSYAVAMPDILRKLEATIIT
jgi:hypothetical protein